jgi:hypothetical protein
MGFTFLWGQNKYTSSADLTIPANVIKMTVKAWGAGGGGGKGGKGGSGGFTQTTITVQSGDTYRILVGQPGGYRNFKDLGGVDKYFRGDSLYYDNDFYYGRGGCGPGVDAIGCGSFSRANIFPTIDRENGDSWMTNNRRVILKQGETAPDGEHFDGPLGSVVVRPGDIMWNSSTNSGWGPGPEVGSGGQMSGVYKITGSNPQFNILNYVVIAGGGGGGGHQKASPDGSSPPDGGAGGGAGGQDGVYSMSTTTDPTRTPEDKFIPRGGSGGVGGTASIKTNSGMAVLPGKDFASGGHGGFFMSYTSRPYNYGFSYNYQYDNDPNYMVSYYLPDGSNGRRWGWGGGGGGYGGGSGGQGRQYVESGGAGGGGYFDPSGTGSRTETGTLRIPPAIDDVNFVGIYGHGGSASGHGIQGYVVVQLGDIPIGYDMRNLSTVDGSSLTLELIANDPETARPSLNYNISTQALHGTVNEDNKPIYTYTPHTNWTGKDSFKVTITDEQGNNSLPSVIEVNTIARSAKSTITYSSPGPILAHLELVNRLPSLLLLMSNYWCIQILQSR